MTDTVRPVDEAPAPPPAVPQRSRRRALLQLLVLITAVPLLFAAALAGLLLERQHAYDQRIQRLDDVFPPEPGRPAPAAGRAQNWLLVGSDIRADAATTGRDADPSWRDAVQRADALMLVHLPADRRRVYIISLPRDAWVPIDGHGNAKINAALAFGGPPLLISTVERLTDVRVDHFAVIDFVGFQAMTDALGGVVVRVTEPVHDPERDVFWPAGAHHLNGAQALDFVRQRRNLPRGDLDRIERQQAFLKSLGEQATGGATLANPLRLNAFLEALTSSVSVDDTLSMADLRSLVIELRSLRGDDVVFMTAPVAGMGREGRRSVVYLDDEAGQALYRALREDSLDAHLAATGDAVNDVDEVR